MAGWDDIGLDGPKLLHRLLQADSPKVLQIDACKTKKDKGRNKHKGKISKVTFTQLLEKYKKESEEKSANRPSSVKASRSPQRQKSKDRNWRREKFNLSNSYPPFGPPIPMSWIPPNVDFCSYPSWDKYDSRAHYPSYSRSSHPSYATPRRPFQSKRIERKLQRLSAEELKKKNMTWVPKDKHKDNSDVQAVVARRATKVKKGNNKSNKQFSRSSSAGMIGNPSWIYWESWMHHNSLYHER
ncbi:hypothetical protein BRADI_5g25228v3, partial [Brachypodium distachyon]